MKSARQKDEALLRDIARARAEARPRIWWLGQSGFLVYVAGKTILFDPYLSDALTRKYANTDKPHQRITERVIAPELLTGIDVITSSHNHTDHLDSETLLPLLKSNPAARFVVPKANVAFVLDRLGPIHERLIPVDAGQSVQVAGVEFTGVPAAHNTVECDERGQCRYLGYVATIGKTRVYHSGDTLLHDRLVAALKPHRVQLSLVPINGNKPERRVAGNLNGAEAAWLSREIGAKLAIPHHFDLFAFNTAPPDEFAAECGRLGQPFQVLENGEGLDLNE